MAGQASLRKLFSPSGRFGLVAAMGVLMLAACETAPPAPPPVAAPPPPPVIGTPPPPAVVAVEIEELGYTPQHMQDLEVTRVAILLPFSASARGARVEAENILNAAELALFERAGDGVLLLPKDTGGTASGARAAAEAAISDGADLILGPLFSAAVAAAGDVAAEDGVPMIAFSTDATVAGDGVFLLSFPPDEEVRRVTEFALEQGATRFAFAGPASAYGQVAYSAYADVITEALGEEPLPELAMVEIPLTEEQEALQEETGEEIEPEFEEREFTTGLVAEAFYDGDISAMTEAAARLASVGIEMLDPAEAAEMSGANWLPSPASAFQVLLLPEGGDRLRMLAPVMLYEDIDPLLVKFVGTGLWRNPDLAREPALAHGWFAGPEPEARARFEAVYEEIFDEEPSRLAGLGYDAASLAALMAAELDGFTSERLSDPEGFLGVDGLFRFREDGTIERGLAVYTVRGGGFRVLDPAPEAFDMMTEPEDVEPDPAS